MTIRRFRAGSTRDALREVREVLGADALILSNRRLPDGGVEITAVSDRELVAAELAQIGRAAPAPAAAPAAALPVLAPDAAAAVADPVPAAAATEAVQDIVAEMRALRAMVEGQLAGFAWGELARRSPVRAELMRTLLRAGFSAALARELVDALPPDSGCEVGLRALQGALRARLAVSAPQDDLLSRGGVFALVGPTGVGKTTTVAKLAARATLARGPGQVALLTTDGYRIGALDQLRVYGRILGVPVYSVGDEAELQLTLGDLAHRHVVLIDTVGMSQRDRRVAEQAALLNDRGRAVEKLLLLSAAAQPATLDDVVQRYRSHGLSGCILTKVDEAVSLGGVLDVVVRHGLRIDYVTNGQRVPEDLHYANVLYLLDRAFRAAPREGPYALEAAEYPLAAAAQSARYAGATHG
jgi:flagellar biosynthesis protein FlhF